MASRKLGLARASQPREMKEGKEPVRRPRTVVGGDLDFLKLMKAKLLKQEKTENEG